MPLQEHAVRELYERHGPALEAHCWQLLGQRADASDAMHDAFVRVLTRDDGPASDDHLVRSLFRISTNVCIDELRQRSVRRRAVPALAARAPVGRADQLAYDARDTLERVLDRCDATTCSIVALRFIDGMPRNEIAATLRTTRKTVFNRLKRLQQLAGELANGE